MDILRGVPDCLPVPRGREAHGVKRANRVVFRYSLLKLLAAKYRMMASWSADTLPGYLVSWMAACILVAHLPWKLGSYLPDWEAASSDDGREPRPRALDAN